MWHVTRSDLFCFLFRPPYRHWRFTESPQIAIEYLHMTYWKRRLATLHTWSSPIRNLHMSYSVEAKIFFFFEIFLWVLNIPRYVCFLHFKIKSIRRRVTATLRWPQIKQDTTSNEGVGLQNKRGHHIFWHSMKQYTLRWFRKLIPHHLEKKVSEIYSSSPGMLIIWIQVQTVQLHFCWQIQILCLSGVHSKNDFI